jgi:hypothetical protein
MGGEKMKTINELNEKIWYRFLKVAYILTLVCLILLSVLLAYGASELPSNYMSKSDLIKFFVENAGDSTQKAAKGVNALSIKSQRGKTARMVTLTGLDPLTFQVLTDIKEGKKTPEYYLSKKAELKTRGADTDLIDKVLQEKGLIALAPPTDYSTKWTVLRALLDEKQMEYIGDNKSFENLGASIKRAFPVYYDDYSDLDLGKSVYARYFLQNAYKGNLFTSIFHFMEYSICWILFWLVVFEIMRRAFYYIVLGELFPSLK